MAVGQRNSLSKVMLKKLRRKLLARSSLILSEVNRPQRSQVDCRTAREFAVALEKTLAARNEMGKEKLPQVVYTTEENMERLP